MDGEALERVKCQNMTCQKKKKKSNKQSKERYSVTRNLDQGIYCGKKMKDGKAGRNFHPKSDQRCSKSVHMLLD